MKFPLLSFSVVVLFHLAFRLTQPNNIDLRGDGACYDSIRTISEICGLVWVILVGDVVSDQSYEIEQGIKGGMILTWNISFSSYTSIISWILSDPYRIKDLPVIQQSY